MKYESVLKQMEIRKKSDPKWIHAPVFWFMSVLSFVRKDWSFYERYVNTLGSTMYVPDKDYGSYISGHPSHEILVRHEYCHTMQYQQEGLKQLLRYVFSSKYRMLYEIEAYCHALAGSRNYRGGEPEPWAKNHILSNFKANSIYMFWLPKRFKLSSEERENWDNMVARLVQDASLLCRDEFVARYLHDYGRLPSTAYKALERHIDRILRVF